MESNVSDLTGSSCSKNISDGAYASSKSGKVSVVSGRKQVQPQKNAFAKIQIAKASRQTPNQVKADDIEQNKANSQLQSSYKWAVSEASNYSNKVTLTSTASQKFNVTIILQTNYGEFKSLLQKHIQQLMNKMYFKYHQQLQEQQNTRVNVPYAPPSLN
jgi:hypothetical protein